jgi:hypothetical protein
MGGKGTVTDSGGNLCARNSGEAAGSSADMSALNLKWSALLPKCVTEDIGYDQGVTHLCSRCPPYGS